MKIALVHMRHAHSGGTERYLDHLAQFLAGRGHEVTIVCRSHVEPPHPEVRFEVLREFAVGPAWRMWAFARAVEAHVRERDYDVVFGLGRTWTHDVVRLGGGCHAAYLELAMSETPTGLNRVFGERRLKHRATLKIEARALARGAYRRVITNSDMVRRDVMRRFGVPAEALTVIYNGVDLDRFHPGRRREAGAALRRELGLGDDECAVLFLGTGYSRKGLDVVIDAFPAVLRERADVKLVVVGFDSARARFEARARELGLEDATLFLGGRRDTEACYAASDLYVLPTRYDPFANTTLEALASGLPVLTTETNGAHELIESGVQGAVVPSGDVAALGAELRRWTEPGRLVEAAVQARQLAERHGIESKMQATEELLLEVSRDRLPA